MKKIIAVCIFLAGFGQLLSAQNIIGFGLKGGMNSQVNKPGGIIIENGEGDIDLSVEDFKYGTQFGAYLRLGNRIFVQPELTFNSNKTDYRIKDNSLGDVIRNEKYQYLDMPILAGFKLGPVRVMGGPVGHYFLNSKSELTDIEGYDARFKQMTWGWQAGLTIGTGRISADIRYEGNFNKQGDHINFFGDQYNFSNNPARLIVGVNIALVK